jgi:protein TonB
MFEGSLVESRGLVVSGTQRWTALGSLTVQCALAGLLLTIPLLRPEVLPSLTVAPRLTVPLPVKPPAPLVQAKATATSATAMSVPASAPQQAAATQRFMFPRIGDSDRNAPTIVTNLPMGPGGPGAPGFLNLASTGSEPRVAVVPARESGPVRVSKGVLEGLLLAPIQPVYPAIARAAHVEGTVVLVAVISKAGRIESLHAVSGPDLLRRAALDAVAVARYRPYLLSGEPTDVETTITVVFRLGS